MEADTGILTFLVQVAVSICLQGLSAEDAQDEYMKILQAWSGYGSTLFNVTVRIVWVILTFILLSTSLTF